MNVAWHFFEKKEPPEEVIILVTGPLGLDLAVKFEGSLYFKNGDDWSTSNLEHWCFNPPTQWAAFTSSERVSASENPDVKKRDAGQFGEDIFCFTGC